MNNKTPTWEHLGKLRADEAARQAKLLAEQHFIRAYEDRITNLQFELYIARTLAVISSLSILLLLAWGS